jgi:protein-tyrosine phosphatase
MPSDLYWIDHPRTPRLAIMARPRAGDWLEDEVAHWQAEGVALVVSLLEPAEARELGLEGEADVCRAQGIEFVNFPIPDRGVPGDRRQAEVLARRLVEADRSVAIHCRAGIGRSASIAALTLVLGGMSADEAFARISAARGLSVPDTDAQRKWVEGSSASGTSTAP